MGRFIDLTGQAFGKLTVLGLAKHRRSGQIMWHCRCECGGDHFADSRSLNKKRTVSCTRCARLKTRGSHNTRWIGIEDISGQFIAMLKRSAKERGIQYSLEKQYLWDLFWKQGMRCALSGININFAPRSNAERPTASLDRIDSKKGYIEGNVQWVHKDINRIKQHFDQDYFIEMCYLVSHKYIEKNSPPMTYEGYMAFLESEEQR